MITLSASLALPEDFKTVNGKEFKNATISHVEIDGIVLRTKSGITKVYFTELPKEVQERFHYDRAKVVAAPCWHTCGACKRCAGRKRTNVLTTMW